jgi:hypothetical protein
LQSRFGFARFHGRFFGSPWPWWWGGLTIGWIGPVFWPYVYYGVRPKGWTGLGGSFDRLPSVVVLELRGAQVAER